MPIDGQTFIGGSDRSFRAFGGGYGVAMRASDGRAIVFCVCLKPDAAVLVRKLNKYLGQDDPDVGLKLTERSLNWPDGDRLIKFPKSLPTTEPPRQRPGF